jgi:hypothetical protein
MVQYKKQHSSSQLNPNPLLLSIVNRYLWPLAPDRLVSRKSTVTGFKVVLSISGRPGLVLLCLVVFAGQG